MTKKIEIYHNLLGKVFTLKKSEVKIGLNKSYCQLFPFESHEK